MAYSPPLAAALSGATGRQLAYWRSTRASKGAVLRPEVSSGRPVLYSFRDLLALRAVVFLRSEKSLQQIRDAIVNAWDLGFRDHLSSYRFESEGKTIMLVPDDDSPVDVLQRPGQLSAVRMSEILAPFRTRNGADVPDLYKPRPCVQVDPERRAGFPVISGTRVPYDVVAGLVQDGVPADRIADYYPSVGRAAAEDAVSFARYVAGHQDEPLLTA